MDFVRGLLNIISDFECKIDGNAVKFPGILQEENGNIILNAKISNEQYRKIALETDILVLGDVSGKKTILIGCHIKSAICSPEDDCASIFVIPNEVIVGKCFSSTPMVKRITVSTAELNYMFSGESPLEPNLTFSKENPSLLNYTFPKAIIANDKYGKIRLYQTFGSQWSINSYKHNVISVIEYSFNVSIPLMNAVAKISAARSLFSFFGNGYIPLGEITFEIDTDENEYGLWLNNIEDVPVANMPFLIDTSVFETRFQEIWKLWLELYEGANPIPTLFYEIVCNRSTRVNSFLNLSQAIEVYSNVFRYDKAKELAEKHGCKNDNIPFRFIYQDILSEYNGALEITESNTCDYAKAFSNMRNFYTHYNFEKYVEPTYEELFSAIQVLRFILLVIVYTAVGISLDDILECKKSIIFSRFDDNTEILLKYSNKCK